MDAKKRLDLWFKSHGHVPCGGDKELRAIMKQAATEASQRAWDNEKVVVENNKVLFAETLELAAEVNRLQHKLDIVLSLAYGICGAVKQETTPALDAENKPENNV